jgi:hypothetical protein
MRVLSVLLLAALTGGAVACTNRSAQPRPAASPPSSPPPGGFAPTGSWNGGAIAATPLPVYHPVNVLALQGLQSPGRCAPREVAPGVWASFDCGGDRPANRALAFAPRMSLVKGPLPFAVDHRVEGTEGPIKNQGAVGACTAFSLSSAMDNGIRRMGRQDVIAPLHVWSKYAVPVMGVAGDETVDQTLTLEPSWPYDPVKACKLTRAPFDACGRAYGVSSGSGAFDPVLRAEQAMADASGRYRLLAIEKLQTRPANIDELSAVLAGGDDVWASFWVNDEAWMSRSLRNGVIPDYEVSSNEGHAVVLAGYRTLPTGAKQFLIHNSWSPRWGEQGYGWISEAMVSRYLRAAYKVRVADALGPANPGPSPGGNGCPSGQVKDAVLSTCAAICPSGSPPAAGVCLPTVPGFPAPGQLPSGPLQLPSPQPRQSSCPEGQAPDLMSGQCTALCPGGVPAIGGMCLPIGQ